MHAVSDTSPDELRHRTDPRAEFAPRSFADMAPGPQPPAAVRIHAYSARVRRAERARGRGPATRFKAALKAPARAARVALQAVRKFGHDTRAHDGTSVLRQFAWMWWLSLRYDYPVRTVYRHRMFSRDRALPMPLFLTGDDAKLLFTTVISRTDRAAAETLADKRRFAVWCAGQGLPTPQILAEFEGGRVTRRAVAEGAAPAADLFAKWGTQFGGDSTQRWRHEDGRYVDDDGRARSFDEIVELLAERSRGGVVILQPRLVNHEALRPLSPRALSTIRVMTTRRPGETPRFLAGLLRMGTGNATADNFAQGGIASVADRDTGTLGEARRVDKQHRTYVYQTHPDTGARIVGFQVPRWQESVRLALEAHQRLGNIPVVGWDVAVLPDGPVLLEGNWNPCVKLLQVVTQTPLLATEFAGAYAAWLETPACAVDDETLLRQKAWTPAPT
jgi:hypothetical protein